MKSSLRNLYFAMSAAVLISCSAPDAISVSGSSTVLPAVSKAADQYSLETGLSVIVNAGGSGGGFNQLAEGQTDIGMMSRDITANELEKFSTLTFKAGSNNEEQTALTQSDAAIGMLSYAWLNEDVRGLSIILGDGRTVEPSLETIRNGEFPFVRNLNVVTRNDIKPSAEAFITYLLGPEGQEKVEESGYIRVSN